MEIIQLFIAYSPFITSWKKAFQHIDRFPEMKDWLSRKAGQRQNLSDIVWDGVKPNLKELQAWVGKHMEEHAQVISSGDDENKGGNKGKGKERSRKDRRDRKERDREEKDREEKDREDKGGKKRDKKGKSRAL